MKNSKKMLIMFSMVLISLFSMPLVNAAGSKIVATTKHRQYRIDKTSTEDNKKFLSGHLEQTITNVNGAEATLEVKFNNKVSTAVVFVFDKNKTNEIADDIKTIGTQLLTNPNISVATAGVNTENIMNSFVTEGTKLGEQLDSIKSATINDGNINNLIGALKLKMKDFDNQVIVLVNNSAATNITEDISNIHVYSYKTAITGRNEIKNATTTEDMNTKLNNLINNSKNNVTITLPLSSRAKDLVDLELGATNNNVTLDDTKTTVTWNAGNIAAGDVKSINYKLKLKKPDVEINEKDININTGATMKFEGANVSGIDIDNCSPIISILSTNTPVNPQTGVTSYLMLGAGLLLVAFVTYNVAKKKTIKNI